jgi:hypothetical protein
MSKLHPNKIHNSIFGIRFFQKKMTKKFITYFLAVFLVMSSITLPGIILNHGRVLAANSSNQTESNLSKPNDYKVGVCFLGICIDTPKIPGPLKDPLQEGVNSLIKDQLRSFLSNEIPITGTEHKLYPTTSQLLNGQFTPQTLYLNALNSSQVIPPGDYEIPVHYYCTKVYTLNGAGNRYRLARLNGRMSNVLSTLYQRASLNKVPIQDVQVLSWSIQSGVSYDNLSSSSKQLVNQLIPDYRQQLEGSFTDKAIKYWNSLSRATSLPSLDATLNQLGDVGTFTRSLFRAREEIINTNFSYRSLANSFVIPQDVNLPGGMETTPWSQINEQIYLRFIAPKGALNDGVAQVRIIGDEYTEIDGSYLVAQATTPLPKRVPNPRGIIFQTLLELIVRSVGIPESSSHQAVTATVKSKSDELPVFIIYSDRMPTIAEHVLSAFRRGHPNTLTYIGGALSGGNRKAACLRAIPRRKGEQCDEYPFASTLEGGSNASIWLVPEKENQRQGGDLSAFILLNNLKAGDRFRVEVR